MQFNNVSNLVKFEGKNFGVFSNLVVKGLELETVKIEVICLNKFGISRNK